jgi:medium-chain acyl-[acyl-carrier-protein] hydrolase
MIAARRSPWLHAIRMPERPRLTLVAFPPAGSGASLYRSWQAYVPKDVALFAIQLPGRENRINEPLPASFEEIINDITSALATIPAPIDAFFGHSFGAVLAFEVMRRLRRLDRALPGHLLASAHVAPGLASSLGAVHELPQAAFIAELRRFKGLVEDILAHRELLEVVLPIVRADLALDHAYELVEEPPLAVPITAFAGADDHVAPPAQMRQ